MADKKPTNNDAIPQHKKLAMGLNPNVGASGKPTGKK